MAFERNMVIDTSSGVRANPFVTLADPKRGVYRRRATGAIHDLWRYGRLSAPSSANCNNYLPPTLTCNPQTLSDQVMSVKRTKAEVAHTMWDD